MINFYSIRGLKKFLIFNFNYKKKNVETTREQITISTTFSENTAASRLINGVIAVGNIKGLINGTSMGANSNNNKIIMQPFFTKKKKTSLPLIVQHIK